MLISRSSVNGQAQRAGILVAAVFLSAWHPVVAEVPVDAGFNPPLVRFESTPPPSETLVQFHSLSDFPEDGGSATINLIRAGDTSFPVTLEVFSVDGSAVAGRDYTEVSETVAFAPGERNTQFEVAIFDNEIADGTRTFALHLTNGTGNSISPAGTNSLLVSIHDEEIVVEMSGTYVVSEIEGFARPRVIVRADPLIYGDDPLSFELGFRTIPLTAELGRDYSSAMGQAVFSTEYSYQGNQFAIAIMDNRTVDGSRAFQVELLPPPSGVQLGERTNVIITITDNDMAAFFGRGANGPILSSAPQPDRKALFGGDFTFFDGLSRNHIARVNSDGSLDESWDVGEGFNGAVREILIQPDGKILVAGAFTEFAGAEAPHIARLEPDGSRDTSFQPGTGWSEPVGQPTRWSLALAANGAIYAAAQYNEFDGELRPGLVRLSSDGSLDHAFRPPIFLARQTLPAGVYDMEIQADGRILVAGAFYLSAELKWVERTGLMRLLPDGTLDPTFERTSPPVGFLALNRKEEIYSLFIGPNSSAEELYRLLPDGTRDRAFVTPDADGLINDLLLLPNEDILLAGRLWNPAYYPFAVVNSNTLSLRKEQVEEAFPQTLVTLSDGSILAGASSYRPFQGNHVIRLSSNGEPVQDLRFLTPVRRSDGSIELMLHGQFKYAYYVEKSADLRHWVRVFTNSTPFLPAVFNDPHPRSAPAVFYRVRPIRGVP